LLGKVSVIALATVVSQASAWVSQVASTPRHAPALAKAAANLAETFVSQAVNPDASFFAATLD
jgi:hypothetical protein